MLQQNDMSFVSYLLEITKWWYNKQTDTLVPWRLSSTTYKSVYWNNMIRKEWWYNHNPLNIIKQWVWYYLHIYKQVCQFVSICNDIGVNIIW